MLTWTASIMMPTRLPSEELQADRPSIGMLASEKLPVPGGDLRDSAQRRLY
jgi:hypothetical protein